MSRKVIPEHLLLSAMASAIMLSFALVGPASSNDLTSMERIAVVSAFILICILGMLSALDLVNFTWIKEQLIPREQGRARPGPTRVGHHPDCEGFRGHTIGLRGRIYCCGCLSLAIGSSIAICLMALLMIFSNIAPANGPYLVLLGLLIVAITFVDAWVHRLRWVHILTNVLLPVGFLLMTIGVTVATGDGSLGLVAVLISILFMDTRISISQRKHEDICRRCGRECKAY